MQSVPVEEMVSYSKAAKRLADHKALPALPALPIKKQCEAKQKSIKAMKT